MIKGPPPIHDPIPRKTALKVFFGVLIVSLILFSLSLFIILLMVRRPPFPIEFSELKAYTTPKSIGSTCGIRGKIHNDSEKSLEYVLLKFKCYDASGNHLDEYWPRWCRASITKSFPPKSVTEFAIAHIDAGQPIAEVALVEAVIVSAYFMGEARWKDPMPNKTADSTAYSRESP